PARFVADFFDDLRQIQLVEHANLSGNHAQYQSNVAALLEDVYTEASEAGNAVSHIKFGGLFEFLFLPVRHHAEGHVQHVFGRDARLVGERQQVAVEAHVREVADLQVQVGSLPLHSDLQKVINMHGLSVGHRWCLCCPNCSEWG